eukprot:1490186-Amphidinium_carterae.1
MLCMTSGGLMAMHKSGVNIKELLWSVASMGVREVSAAGAPECLILIGFRLKPFAPQLSEVGKFEQ